MCMIYCSLNSILCITLYDIAVCTCNEPKDAFLDFPLNLYILSCPDCFYYYQFCYWCKTMQVMFCAAREIIFSDMFLVVEAIVDKIYSSIGHSTYIAPNVSFMLFQKLYPVRIQLAALQEVHALMHTRTGCRLVVMFLSLLQSN